MIDVNLVVVTAVRHIRDHVLWLRFNDGLEGEVDLSDALQNPLHAPLRDVAEFAQVRLDGIAPVWPSGDDWSPEDLHARLLREKGLSPRSIDDVLRRRLAHLSGM